MLNKYLLLFSVLSVGTISLETIVKDDQDRNIY